MEVWVVNSLRELRLLRELLRGIPVVFTGGYVQVRVQVGHIDCVKYSLLYQTIMADIVENFGCEVLPQETIDEVATLAQSLVIIKRLADETTRDFYNGNLYNERLYQMMGRAAQVAFATGTGGFADGDFGDVLFSVTKSAVSCANTGLELLTHSDLSDRRWNNLVRRLGTLQFDSDFLLRCPVPLL